MIQIYKYVNSLSSDIMSDINFEKIPAIWETFRDLNLRIPEWNSLA